MPNNTLTIRTVTITPEDAAAHLARNINNRPISKALVSRLALSMARGEWVLNGEAIKIANDGHVLDGQHRLTACVNAQVPFETLVIRGMPDSAQYTMDTGKSRSVSDMLSLSGETNCNSLASTIAALIRSKKWGIKVAVGTSSQYPLTVKEQLDFLADNPWVRDLERFGSSMLSVGLTSRISSLLFHTFQQIDAEDAEYFFTRLRDGVGLDQHSPILALKNWLTVNRLDKAKVARETNAHVYMAAITIKAWNAFREGRDVKTLRFTAGGATPESFPEPR